MYLNILGKNLNSTDIILEQFVVTAKNVYRKIVILLYCYRVNKND